MRISPGLFKSMFILGMLFLFPSQYISAQQTGLTLNHPISLPSDFVRTTPAVGELNIVAVMVEFQADTNRLTSGTGIFGSDGFEGLPYLTNQEVTHVDPLPHNQTYFETHLEFAKNYFLKASDSQLSINYQVLPQVYRLDKHMEEYSPIGETFTLEKIAQLYEDLWAEVEEQGGFNTTGLDPENTAFVIFHAGIGRDVELTGTSLDITPFDLPSITLKESDLEILLEDPDFEGFPINGGSFLVNNSILIPRTQSRRGEDISGGEVVFALSINGLLSASIGSYLGLPDLFNTTNGQPAIGRFGLMDGAGIFNYNGLFPAEPSAWEKVYLGWEEPFIITPETDGVIQLPAASLNEPSSIAKVELSSTEYFLIENRHRDPDLADSISAEVTLTIRQASDGELVQQTFTNFDEDFIFQTADFDTMLIPGTIVDVSNFDWGLPGGIDIGEDEEEDTDDDRHLNGGILIWHIDDAIISQNIGTNSVNADDLRRGVDLEEGDGAQDIGRDPGLLDNSPSFGYSYDFWWSDNNYRVITSTSEIDLNPNNEFGPDTYPNNESNSGAKSFFELYDFSDITPIASFRIRSLESVELGFEETLYLEQEASDYYSSFVPRNFPLSLGILELASEQLLIVPSNSDIHMISTDNPEPNFGISYTHYPYQQPLILDQLIVASDPEVFDSMRVQSVDTSNLRNWSIDRLPPTSGFISSQDGNIIDLDFTSTSIDAETGLIIQNDDGYTFLSEIIDGNFVGIAGQTVSFVGENIQDHLSDASDRLFAGTISSNLGNYYYLIEDGTFSIVDPSSEEPITEIFSEEKAEWPAIIDEGLIYRVNRSESSVEGYNFNGALVGGTPIYAQDGIQFIGTPLIADITGDNIQDILVVGQDDYSVNIFAYETNGNPIEGFPLYVGGSVGRDAQPIHPVFYEDVLYAISHTGDLRAWRFLNFTSSQWPARYGENPYNKVSAYIEFTQESTSNFTVLNDAETYNWPNPANESTNLRFQLEEPGGTVEITIIDYSGRIIFERTIQSDGGTPEEIQITTSDWGSGAYFARVEATVAGRSESKIVKIGVVH